MYKNTAVLALALLFSLSHAAESVKVCVYDPEKVMGQSKELGGLTAEVDKKYQPQFDDLKKEEEALRTDANNLQSKATVMNEVARETEQEKLVRRKRDLDAKAERVLEDYKRDRQNVSMRFFKKLEESVSSFAQANAYDLVLPKGPGVYALAKADQTTSLVTYMNKDFENSKKTLAPATVAVAKK